MKKTLHFLCSMLLVLLFSLSAIAQQPQPLPIDAKVRIGKLPNGLTYYIRHNAEPKGQAEFFIAQKVGSMQEEENQRGLAHFLEHMAFNGTTNLPDKMLMHYLESIGVKFGANLNAYTSFDETVYNVSSVPVSREGIIDTCLLILHDWSSGIALKTEEINKERGVIHEEWRTGQGAQMRMWNTLLPEMYPNNRYGQRLPIGIMEVVDNFPPELIRAYYKEWYRPDLQAIVIVGDINVDQIEAKIKTLFADIPASVNPTERVYFPVADNEAPIVSIATDPEATSTRLQIYYKHDVLPENLKPTAVSLQYSFLKSIMSSMLNARLSELIQKPNAPFLQAMVFDAEFFVSRTKDAFTANASVKEGGALAGLEGLVRELQRVDRFGFTASEYERAKSNFLRMMESQYNEREKQRSSAYAQEYVRNFENGEVIPGIEFEYNFYKQLAPNVPLEAINKYASSLISDKNIVITVTGPQKDGLTYPTKDEILASFDKVSKENITAYTETVSNDPLVAKLPKPGKITKETANSALGTTEWTLSNGARVVIKTTDFKEDQILFIANSHGGYSLTDFSKDAINDRLINPVISLGGWGAFSKTDLMKVLAGKRVSINPSVSTRSEGLNGSCSPKDLETMLQLMYLHFTAPRTDQEAFQAFMTRMKAQLENAEADPMTAFSDSIASTFYNNHPLAVRIKAGDLEQINYQHIVNLYKARFSNAGDFVFTFVGNIDPAVLKPLAEQYIASLPGSKQKETERDVKMDLPKGIVKNYFEKEMTTPKTTVYSLYSGKMDYSLENIVKMSALSQIMSIVYTETIREEEGGTYGVGARGSVGNYPNGNFTFMISFDTNAELRDKLVAKAHEGLQQMAGQGPKATDVNKVKEYMLKKQTEDLRENGYWLNTLDIYSFSGVNRLTDYVNIVNSLTPEMIRDFAKGMLSQGNDAEVVITGVEKK